MWIKYKHTFGWGEDRQWKYIEAPDRNYLKELGYTDIEEYLLNETDIARNYEYSDKYRGLKLFEIPHLPMEEITKRIKQYKNYVKYYKEKIKRCEEMLEEIGEIKQGDFKV